MTHKPIATSLIAKKHATALAIGVFSSFLSLGTLAQQVYRIVGPDGRISFSDQPPPSSANVKVTTGTGVRAGTDNSVAALPFELREPAGKYPVTLYTSTNCGPCASGKAMLAARGIPFNEKTVNTSEDSEALQRLSGENGLPFLTIGSQQVKGYSDVEWAQYLDAAGYPKSSVLPAGYRSPPPTPLVAVKRPDAAAAGGTTAAADGAAPIVTNNRRQQAARAPAPAENTNPAGIKF